MTWVTELAKAENDTLRQAGDVAGILAKYNALSGGGSWRRCSVNEAFEIAEVSAATWTDSQMSEFRGGDTHLTPLVEGREVRLDSEATRTWVQANIAAEEWANVVALYGPNERLYEARGLPALSKQLIISALSDLPDSPYGDVKARMAKWQEIKAKLDAGNPADTTSLANLTTICDLIGVS